MNFMVTRWVVIPPWNDICLAEGLHHTAREVGDIDINFAPLGPPWATSGLHDMWVEQVVEATQVSRHLRRCPPGLGRGAASISSRQLWQWPRAKDSLPRTLCPPHTHGWGRACGRCITYPQSRSLQDAKRKIFIAEFSSASYRRKEIEFKSRSIWQKARSFAFYQQTRGYKNASPTIFLNNQ